MKNSVKMMKRESRTKQWKYHVENPVDTLKLLDAVQRKMSVFKPYNHISLD